MEGADHLQPGATTLDRAAVRSIMIKQEAEFQYQLQELHRLHRKQMEIMGKLTGKAGGPSEKQKVEEETVGFNRVAEVQKDLYCDNCHRPMGSCLCTYQMQNSSSSKQEKQSLKLLVNPGQDSDAPITPEIKDSSISVKNSDGEGLARSAAEALFDLSSTRLLWFAEIVDSAKHNADLAPRQQKKQRARKTGQQSKGKRTARKTGGTSTRKRQKGTSVIECIRGWGELKNSRRSQRVPAADPFLTFMRGAILSKWR